MIPSTSVQVTESLVDAKDGARQAEVHTDIARVLLAIEQGTTRLVYWIIGVGVGVAGVVIAVLR